MLRKNKYDSLLANNQEMISENCFDHLDSVIVTVSENEYHAATK